VISVTGDQIGRQIRLTSESSGTELSLFTLVEAFFRYLKLFLAVAGVVLALALWWIFATPRRYESEASILVQNARSNELITPGNSNGPTVMKDVTEEQLNSELEVLTSKDLLDDVVKPGWNTAKERTDYSKDELLEHEKAVSSLSRRLDASLARKSHVLLAKITAPSPEEAQEQMQRLFAAFMNRQRQIGRPPGATRFFTEQAERYKNELSAAQTTLAEFQKQQQMVSVSEQEATLSAKLTLAKNQLSDADTQIGDLSSRIQKEAQLKSATQPRQNTVQRAMPLSGALDQLTLRLVTLENQRTELLNKYPPTDRMVQQVDAQIAETKAGIHNAGSDRAQDTSTDINPTWQQLQTDLTMTQAQLDGVRARREVLRSQISAAQAKLETIEALSPQFTALQHKVTELDNNYQAFLQKRDDAEVADSMDRQDLLNFAIVQAPTYSLSPVHPKPLRDTLLGLMTACLLGAIAVFLMESVRDTVATAADLERWSRYPALATIPWTPQGKLVSVSRPSATSLGISEETETDIPGQKTRRLAYLQSTDGAQN
jgi:uncharacterized protein involved in exopolysaccharide biosynthesis